MHLNGFTYVTSSTALLTFLCLITEDQLIAALRDVRVNVPHAVRRGEKATLKCYYDMEGDSLYSVKWYKGRREFYRYTPKETPAMKVFQFAGVRVERSASNESQLVLESVNMATTGKYSCEVSADAPSFHTLISAGELEVVEVPGKDPIISGIRSRYRIGDIVRGNCTSRHSKPAANLTWTINGYETNPAHIRHHKVPKDAREMETSISGIHFVVTPQHFVYGKLKIRCTAHIHDVYWKSTEKSIEQERHKHSTSGNMNFVNTFSEDYFDVDEEDFGDRSDTYMTHIKGDVSSLNSNSAANPTFLIASKRGAELLLFLLLAIQQLLTHRCLTSGSKTKSNKNSSGYKHTNNNTNNNSNNNKMVKQSINSIRTIKIIAKGHHLRVGNFWDIKKNHTSNSEMEIRQQQQQRNTRQALKANSFTTKEINKTNDESTKNLYQVEKATAMLERQLQQKLQQLQTVEAKPATRTTPSTKIVNPTARKRRTTTKTAAAEARRGATLDVNRFTKLNPSFS